MKIIYRAKASDLLDAMAELQITTAQGLAECAGISRNTASKVLSGKPVTVATVAAVVKGLNEAGNAGREMRKASDLFSTSERTGAKK